LVRRQALEWVRSIRDQCQAEIKPRGPGVGLGSKTCAGVPYFLKQLGGPRPTSGGRLLDGWTWDEMPEVRP
jgi:protein gp37